MTKNTLKLKRIEVARLIKLYRQKIAYSRTIDDVYSIEDYSYKIYELLRFTKKHYAKNVIAKEKRILKRNYLLKKLCNSLQADILKSYNKDNTIIKTRITDKKNISHMSAKGKFKGKNICYIDNITITLSIPQLKRIYKLGMKNGFKEYYTGRHANIDSITLHNRKKMYLFGICHELGHAKMLLHGKLQGKINHINNEKLADKIAFKLIKGL